MPEENIRVQIVLSQHIHRLLEVWGEAHGRSVSTMAAQIINQKIEESIDLIKMWEEEINATRTNKEN